MSGGKKNPAVLWYKLGYAGNKIVGIVKNYFRTDSNGVKRTITFAMKERLLSIADDTQCVILGPKEIEAIYFTAKSMGWMNDD